MKLMKVLFLVLFLGTIFSVSAQHILAGDHSCEQYFITYNAPMPLSSGPDRFLDINQDGISDFKVTAQYTFALGGTSSYAFIFPLGSNEIAFGHTDTSYTCSGASTYTVSVPKAFSLNDTINASQIWSHIDMCISNSGTHFGTPACYYGVTGYNSNNNYIGVRLITSLDTTYGWLRIGNDSINHRITETACERRTPLSLSVSIVEGDTTFYYWGDMVYTLTESGDDIVSRQWMKDGVDIPGATGNSLPLLKLTRESSGDYSCRVVNICSDTVYTASRRLNVYTEFSVGPNPLTDEIRIMLESWQRYINYELIDTLGVVVRKGNIEKGISTIEISDLASGIYYLKINGNTIKLMKN